MPGARLTEGERRAIALGLADDLAYAEIARRLGRPTSTVTREVVRSGGPRGYRADLAHRGARHRARRRRPAARRPARPAAAAAVRSPDLVAFEADFTAVLVATGVPRMAARVLTALYGTDTGRLTASQLAEQLQISRASVSKAIRFLEGQGLVRRERGPGRGDRYTVDGDLFYRSVRATTEANDRLVAAARRGAAALGEDTDAARRLQDVAVFLDCISAGVAQAADQALQRLRGRGDGFGLGATGD